MLRNAPQQRKTGAAAAALSTPIVALLVGGAFCAGVLFSRSLPPTGGGGAAALSEAGAAGNELQQQQQQQQKQATGTGPLEAALASCPAALGALAPRLPLPPPAASGDAALHYAGFQVLTWYPRMVLYPQFVSAADADAITRLARPRLAPSTIKLRPGESAAKAARERTSRGAFIPSDDDPGGVLAALDRRLAALTLLPESHGESFYVLHYRPGERYNAHLDVFDEGAYGGNGEGDGGGGAEAAGGGGGGAVGSGGGGARRVATVLVYLSDVERGGETSFKREGENGAARPVGDPASCGDGVGGGEYLYRPRKGDALLFWSVTPDGKTDPRSLHGGCPVIKGDKWVATKWLWNRPRRRASGGFGWGPS